MKPKQLAVPKEGFKLEIAKVKKLHADIVGVAQDARDRALEIGEVLAGIKEALNHGDWLPWISANLPELSTRSVQNYLRLWKYRDRLKNATGAYLVETYSAALARVSEPDDGDKSEATDEPNANAGSEQGRRRELLRRLGDAFMDGLDDEDTAVLEALLANLPAWRPRLLEAARCGFGNAGANGPANPAPLRLAA